MNLKLFSFEDFLNEIKERNIKRVRIQVVESEKESEIAYNIVLTALTTLPSKQYMIIVYEDELGAIPKLLLLDRFKEDYEKAMDKIKEKIENIKKLLNENGIEFKNGIYY